MSDTGTIHRSFPITLARTGDDRVLGGRCVPYGVTALVSDDGRTQYREMFERGAFARSVTAAGRVQLRYKHGQGVLDTIGRATELVERDDGLHGLFRVFAGLVGDQALTLYDEGILPGLSVAGIPTKSVTRADGVVVRQRVHLTEISLCEDPAYADALVSVRRSRVDLDLPPPPTDEQMERLARLGIRVSRAPSD